MGLVQNLTSLAFNFMPALIHIQPGSPHLTTELLTHKGALITICMQGRLTWIASFHVHGDQRRVLVHISHWWQGQNKQKTQHIYLKQVFQLS